MKRHILIIPVLLFSIFFAVSITDTYKNYQNVLLTQVTIPGYDAFNYIIKYPDTQTNIDSLDMYKTTDVTSFSAQNRKDDDTKVGYEVTGDMRNAFAVNLITGRFIFRTDFDSGNKFAVIDKNSAIKLFMTTKCVGNYVTINSVQYQVCGVYENINSLQSKMGAVIQTGTNAVFITAKKPTQAITSSSTAASSSIGVTGTSTGTSRNKRRNTGNEYGNIRN